jgi:thiamine-monophosphate kinase
MMNEFQLIQKFFTREEIRNNVKIGVGDDGAVLSVNQSQDLVVVTDTLVAGVHFFGEQSASALGHKTLSVNLSDLAAMGAEPDWVTLNLVLPEANSSWLQEFSRGFFDLADRYSVALVGGDTSRGPLSITATAGGWVPCDQANRRSEAKIGDLIYVSGTLGDAALGLNLLKKREISIDDENNYFLKRLMRPEPRISLGQLLRPFASAVIDISDGFISDLGHVTTASGSLGAVIYEYLIPIHSEAIGYCEHSEILEMALSGGEDYELCFTVAPSNQQEMERLEAELDLSLTLVGHIDGASGVRVFDEHHACREIDATGYLHYW